MLVATPFREAPELERPPRVISEIRKTCPIVFPLSNRPKLTGELLVKCGIGGVWWPRKAQIHGGQLHLSSNQNDEPPIRIPLRHLSLRAGPLPNSLALCKGSNVVITLQTANEQLFDVWVKTIAIELIRQTPLEAVKYLDILALTKCWKQQVHEYSSNPQYPSSTLINSNFNNHEQQQCPIISNNNNNNKDEPEVKKVEDLLKKCQNSENYVPVKEKLVLFETLCKLGRKVRSTEDVSSCRQGESATKRARSLHDLSNINSHIAVREICKYFENYEKNSSNKRLLHSSVS